MYNRSFFSANEQDYYSKPKTTVYTVKLIIDILLSDIDVDVLVVAYVNMSADVMTALRDATPAPVEAFSC